MSAASGCWLLGTAGEHPPAVLLCCLSLLCLHLLSPASYRFPPPPHHPFQQALQAGLAELRGWVAYVGGEWCCSAEDAETAIERVTQAARFLLQVRLGLDIWTVVCACRLQRGDLLPTLLGLLNAPAETPYVYQGKDDCIRKAYRGVDIRVDLTRSCPALSLQQVGICACCGALQYCLIRAMLHRAGVTAGVVGRTNHLSRCTASASTSTPTGWAPGPPCFLFPCIWFPTHTHPSFRSTAQVYRLSEHQHDDWLGSEGASGRESIALLETLKRLMAEQRARMCDGAAAAGSEDDEDEEDLLVRVMLGVDDYVGC